MQKLFELLNDERFAIDNFEFPDIKSDNVDFSLPENILANYNKLRENLVAYEAIEFQKYSKLGEALTKVFQKAIDYRDSLIPEMDKLPSSEKDRFLRKSIINYCRTTFVEDFKKAIKSSVNITVEKVIMEHEPSCSYAVIPVLQNDSISGAVWEKVYNQASGEPSLEELDVTLKDLNTITDQLDLKTGRLKSDKWGKKNQYKMYCHLFFDPLMSFGMRTYLPLDQFEEFTARELAAIYLHEIGHMTSLIERSSDLYFIEQKTRSYINILEKANSKALYKVLLDNKKIILEYLDKVSKNIKDTKLMQSLKQSFGAVLDIIGATFDSLEANPDNKAVAYIWAFFRAVIIFYCKFFYLTLGTMRIVGLLIAEFSTNYLVSLISSKVLVGYNENDFKVSDVLYTELDYTSSERDADEYAVRSGFGKEQTAGLRKMVEIMNKFYRNSAGSRLPEIIRQNKLIWYITEYISFVNVIINSFMPFPVEVHGRDIWRFEKMAQQTIKLFKEIPNKEMRDIYLTQYEGILKEIATAKKSKYVKLDQLNVLISNLARPNIFSAILGNGNLPNDYNKVREELESLMNNKMYYASAKLAQLAE